MNRFQFATATLAFVLCTQAGSQVGFSIKPIRIPSWILICPQNAKTAVQQLNAYIISTNTETASLRTEFASLTHQFEEIKALTLASETKEIGKIKVLPDFPTPAALVAVPTFPNLSTPYDCRTLHRDSYKQVPPRIKLAEESRTRKEALVKDIEQLKATYESFKAMTRDL